MSKRIYYLTSEIIPFAETYELAAFSKGVPGEFIDRKYDFRLMMPKYGFISDRRYILREVIRLRNMKLNYMGVEFPASVKSAFIPNTKVQVYFLEHEDFYKPTTEKLYEPKGKEDHNLNSVRFGYFSLAALNTLKYLRWKPDVLICNDWQMSLLPIFLDAGLVDKEFLEGVKIVQMLHSKSDKGIYTKEEYKKIGLIDFETTLEKDGKIDSVAESMKLADYVLFINHGGTNLIEEYKKDDVFSGIINEKQKLISTFDVEDENWEESADEIIEIVEKL
jgi:starch synthase